MELSRDKFPWVLAVGMYLLSYGCWALYLGAVYWDDWVVFNVKPEALLYTFGQAGTIFNWSGHLHVFLTAFGPQVYHLLTFILMFCSGYLFWLILGLAPVINRLERSLVALLILILPLNAARIAMIDFPYTLCYFIFLLAWYLLVRRSGYILKALSLALFLFSFNTSSMLVFYAVPIAHAAYLAAGLDLRKYASWALKNILFMLAPFVWFYVKNNFFAPTGLYAGYNTFKYDGFSLTAVLSGALLAVVFLAWLIQRKRGKAGEIDRGLAFLFCGCFLVWLAAFPYLMVDAWPSFADWNSRHQLLMPLGAAVALVGLGTWASYGNALRFSILALAVSVLVNLNSAFEYYVDWIKQREVIQLIARSAEIKSARTILFNDKTTRFNAHGREYRFHEYNGWLKFAFGDQIRWGMDDVDWTGSLAGKLPPPYDGYISMDSNAKDYVAGKPDLIVTIKTDKGRVKTALTGTGGFSLDILRLDQRSSTGKPSGIPATYVGKTKTDN